MSPGGGGLNLGDHAHDCVDGHNDSHHDYAGLNLGDHEHDQGDDGYDDDRYDDDYSIDYEDVGRDIYNSYQG